MSKLEKRFEIDLDKIKTIDEVKFILKLVCRHIVKSETTSVINIPDSAITEEESKKFKHLLKEKQS